jgi:hypothetical protein
VVNRRGVLAAVLGLLYPGLGHVYLRKWVRALSWFALALVVAAVVVPTSAYEAFEAGGFDGLLEASESFGMEVTLSLFAVRLLNVADAYLVAVREAAASAAGHVPTADEDATCSNCGGELDEEIDFCPWCTQRLEIEKPAEDAD